MTLIKHLEPEEEHASSWFTRFITLFSRQPKNREQLIKMLRRAENSDVLNSDTLGMVERILQVSEMQVREVMVSKAQMVTVNKKSSFKDILAIVIESGHSRFPVMDLTNKEVIGILLAKDLLKYYSTQEPQSFHLTAITRPTIFTPQSKRLDILLREFRANRNHIAIVLDEYGHVAGLVTIEDVLEQIVGDIEDEYDIDEDREQITSLDDGSFIVKASTLIAEFNHYFHTTFRDDEFDTIGGIILQAFSHLPKRGEKVKIAGLYFKVLHSDNRHVYLLEVKPVKAKEPLSSAEK